MQGVDARYVPRVAHGLRVHVQAHVFSSLVGLSTNQVFSTHALRAQFKGLWSEQTAKSALPKTSIALSCLGTSGFVASIGGKRREEPRSPASPEPKRIEPGYTCLLSLQNPHVARAARALAGRCSNQSPSRAPRAATRGG